MKKAGRITLIAFAAALVIGAAVFAHAVRPDAGGALPAFADTRAACERSDAQLFDRHGVLIHELRVDFGERRTGWAKLADISPAFIDSVLASEDRRFRGHAGVDWLALASAAVDNKLHGTKRGASTITMQLVSRLMPGNRMRAGRRGVTEKLAQIRAARALEQKWSKDEILEAYLNLVSFRGELTGISAASRGLYDKEPAGLERAESLVLASLIRSPNAPPAEVLGRARALALSMGGGVDEPGIGIAASALAHSYYIRPTTALAPHVARMLLGKGNREAATTIDADFQRFATELVRHYMAPIKSRNAGDCALLAVDNQTGDVLAYVGNSGEGATAYYVDGVRARRQAGSTLKPFLYGLAFEKRIITTASLIEDSPLDVPTAMGTYSPGNYDNTYRGTVTARTALASSLNIPAVRTLALMGEEPFKKRLAALGFTGLRDGDYYGLSLALGTAEISLWELVNAYRTLANGGVAGALTLTPGGSRKRRRVYSREAAFLVSDILSDREARSATFGLENPLSTRFWSAVKTGTSKDMRDNWCVGYTDRYTVGVWVGNFSGEPMWDVSGITGAAPIWYETMARLNSGASDGGPEPPSGVARSEVLFADTGTARTDWFVKGTEPGIQAAAGTGADGRILYPPDGTVMAVDPDIPAGLQRVFFEADGLPDGALWYLDGECAGSRDASWQPVAGMHTLALAGPDGYLMDNVSFSVR